MAHNKLYRNFIILQEDERSHASSGDKALSGYAKIEAKGDKCKISFYAQNLKKDDKYSMVLICYKKDMKQVVDLGSLEVSEVGKGESSKEYYVNNIAGLDFAYDKISGAAICERKSGELNFLMYGFMNGENISDSWKTCKVVKHDERHEEVDKDKLELRVLKEKGILQDGQEDDEEIRHKKDKKCKENKAEKKDKNCKESKEEKKDKDCKEYKEEKKGKDCKEYKEEKKDKDCKEYKEEKKEKDDKECKSCKCCEENKKEKEYKKDKKDECNIEDTCGDHKKKNDDHEYEYKCCVKRPDIASFDEYETRIEEEKTLDPFEFELRGSIGQFFEGIVDGFEEIKSVFMEIRYCKWYKINIGNIDDMCNISNYNKYTIAYYPMINYYPYIRKYGHFMLGYKCDEKGNLKYIVYAVPGKKDSEEQPYAGKTGFVTWMSSENGKSGYWLMFYDYKNSTIVVPMK